MGRKALEENKVRRLVYFDDDIWEALEFLYFDKFLGRMTRNSVNTLVNNAMRKEVKDVLEVLLKNKEKENVTDNKV